MSEKITSLGEILTEDQCKEVTRILNESLDDFEKGKKLKLYFHSFQSELEAKGVDAGYLAYAVLFQIHGRKNGNH
jgi:hypothetical protein